MPIANFGEPDPCMSIEEHFAADLPEEYERQQAETTKRTEEMPTEQQIERIIELAARYMDERDSRLRAWNNRWDQLRTFEQRAGDGVLANLNAKCETWNHEAVNVIYDILHIMNVPGYEKPRAR